MSIKKIEKEPTVLEARRTVIVTQSLAAIGSQAFQVDLQRNQVDFVPTRMAIRQIAYVNLATGGALGTDQGIFTVYCSLARQPVAFVLANPLGITLAPEQVINIPTYNPIVEFQVLTTPSSYQTVGVSTVPLTAPTGMISMSLEFF
jgi:hypothetical protein